MLKQPHPGVRENKTHPFPFPSPIPSRSSTIPPTSLAILMLDTVKRWASQSTPNWPHCTSRSRLGEAKKGCRRSLARDRLNSAGGITAGAKGLLMRPQKEQARQQPPPRRNLHALSNRGFLFLASHVPKPRCCPVAPSHLHLIYRRFTRKRWVRSVDSPSLHLILSPPAL